MTITVTSNEPVQKPDAAAAVEGKPESVGVTPSAPEAEASEQEISPESETEEPEEVEGEEAETEEPETETQKVEDKPQKKKGGFQRRIDKLNARASLAQQEAEYWKQQALKGASATETKPGVETPITKAADVAGKPLPEKFDTHAEYVEALTDWKTDQKLNERDRKAEQSKVQTEQKTIAEAYNARVKTFAEGAPDFNEVLDDVMDIPVSPAVKEIILSSENGPAIAYELAKNREEFARVCKLPPLAAAREIGKLESRIAEKSSAEKVTEAKKTTKAPAPLTPVTAGGKGSVKKSISDPGLSQREYEALRAEQTKKRRQG